MRFNREEAHRKIYIISLLLIVVALPFSIRISNLAIVLLTLNWLLEGNFRQKFLMLHNYRPRGIPLAYIFLGLFIIYVAGMLYTADLARGWHELEKKISLIVFPVVLGSSNFKTIKSENVLKAFAFTCIAASIICLIYAFLKPIKINEVYSIELEAKVPDMSVYQIFFDDGTTEGYNYSEANSVSKQVFPSKNYQNISFSIPDSIVIRRFRIDPGNKPGIVRVRSISLQRNSKIYTWDSVAIFKAFTPQNNIDSFYLEGKELVINVNGHDPYFSLKDDLRSVYFEMVSAEDHPSFRSGRWENLSYAQLSSNIYIHPVYFSMYLTFSALILINFYFNNKIYTRQFKSWIIFLVLLYITIFIVNLSGRIVILIYPFIISFFLIFKLGLKRKILHVIMASLVLGLLMTVSIFNNPVTYYRLIQELKDTKFTIPDNAENWNSTNMRILHWKASLDILKHAWTKGLGTGDTKSALRESYKKYDMGIYKKVYNAHNQYLQAMLALGITGLLYFLFVLVVPVILSFKSGNYLYTSFLLLFALCCLTESMLEVQKGIVFYGLFNSLFAFHFLKRKFLLSSRAARKEDTRSNLKMAAG